jgi:hypothetical protein
VTHERWRQIETLYEAARRVASEDRGVFLSGISADLRGDVEALLARGVIPTFARSTMWGRTIW